ncbi:radical SAM protein [bacterium]|nr:radical SAM protein [bacterium]MBU1994488.1 radical SAM protein [bacterium]
MATKYSEYKIFHFQDKLDSLSKEVDTIKAPLHIRIKPTNVCNHSCWYCSYQSLDDIQLGKDMTIKDTIPKDKMREIIEDCIDMEVQSITFSGGGEPFLYPHLLETVQNLATSSIKFASLTNGSRLEGEIADVFAKYGTWVRVSIDGWDDESYAKYRNVKHGEFTRVINNMKNFAKIPKRKCNLGISFIVDNKNYKEIYNFSKLMKEIGVDSIKIAPCVIGNNGIENNRYHEPIYQEAKNLSMQVKDELEDASFEVFDSYHLLDYKFDKDYKWCPYVQINPVIGADMNVYTCHDKAYNLDTGGLGSIKKRRFKELWMNEKDKFFNVNPSIDCNHHCAVNEKNKLIFKYLDVDKEHMGFV